MSGGGEASLVGVDVTSTPSRRKPLVAARGHDDGGVVVVEGVERWTRFAPLEQLLEHRDAHVVSVDAPLGLPRDFVEATGWPTTWGRYVRELGALDRAQWRSLLRRFTEARPPGSRYLLRDADVVAGAQSPLNAVRPPVALMLHELAPRLATSGVDLPGLRRTQVDCHVVEAYPALVAATLLADTAQGRGVPRRRAPYKDDQRRHGRDRAERREQLVRRLRRDAFPYAVRVELPDELVGELVDEVTADALDAVLCLVQASWVARRADLGVPAGVDHCEGWIPDPATLVTPPGERTGRARG